MKQLFTNENRLLAMHTKNVLENAGIKVEVRNEHTAGSAIPGHQVWLELWVENNDYASAVKLLEYSESDDNEDWCCSKCGEENAETFALCWNCQAEQPQVMAES